MEPKVKTSAGMETASETVARINAAKASWAPAETTPNSGARTAVDSTNPLLEALTARLLQQGQGISSSASSQLNAEIAAAMGDVQRAGESTAARIQSEREREVAFAKDRASATLTSAMESGTGYARQVTALRELTDTTEKSVRDLDKRYQESLLMNDAETAKQLSELRLQKLKFQQEQEQNFFNNMLGVANMQQEATQIAQQNEQFWTKLDQEQKQFQTNLAQSKYQFEQNYGLSFREMGLKEQQLELERDRNNLSWAEYRLRKGEIAEQKMMTNTQALVAQDIKNKLADGTPKEFFNSTEYLSLIKEKTGFNGSLEDLSTVVYNAYSGVTNDTAFMADLNKPAPGSGVYNIGGLLGRGSIGEAAGQTIGSITSGLGDLIFGVPSDRKTPEQTTQEQAAFYNQFLNNPLIKYNK